LTHSKHLFYLQVIAESMSVDEIGGLKELFKKFDTDNSGTITFDELKYGLKRLGSALSKNEIQMLMDAVTPLTLNHSFSGKYIMILIFVLYCRISLRLILTEMEPSTVLNSLQLRFVLTHKN
jgi:hypothetical protein